MQSLFRRKSSDVVEETSGAPESVESGRAKAGYTPAKGRETPKRPTAGRQPAGNAKALTKEESKERKRTLRQEAAAEYRREGGPRDRGPERQLARNVVDSRRTAGTYFFGGALIVLIGSNGAMPDLVRTVATSLWGVLLLAVVVDAVLIARKIKRLVAERYPKTEQKMGSLYMYAIMRSLTFRRMRVPGPAVKFGEKV
ncbi:membrane protein [Asanoa ishikariensis]|uniref:DUF3043 domain-containing protein n=1 Tax=Asanoa ishikariensis TaxID=137265 RepID=A0A1H3P272_9ACTN|nr:DUF3043 domain-containing protein [Asanoa ishikariensis]GIF68190.1 membrane protein [Asanoa ishikariensis]SDY94905.1 Protein of unknown function [Asanoa ishikariensis]